MSSKTTVNVLISSVGRRVSLVQSFRQSLNELEIEGNIIGVDFSNTAPALYKCDQFELVPRITDPSYVDSLLAICSSKNVNILIPLLDSELLLLSKHRDKFENIDVNMVLSGTETLEICRDKRRTFEFLKENEIPTPNLYTQNEVNDLELTDYPLFIKPWNGSASKDAHKLNSPKDFIYYSSVIDNPMIQQYIDGEEYTIDAYIDHNGNTKCIVPRRRLEVRDGETSKGITIRDTKIIDSTKKLISALPHPIGCLTIQCIKSNDGEIYFIEINPRFGGGFPLTHLAGANFPLWIINEYINPDNYEESYTWEENTIMLRYDAEVILRGTSIGNKSSNF